MLLRLKQPALCLVLGGLLGFGSPIFAVGVPLWASDLSTDLTYGSTLRWFQILYSAGGIVFNALPGVIFDHTGEYVSSYVLFGALSLVSMVMILLGYRVARPAGPGE